MLAFWIIISSRYRYGKDIYMSMSVFRRLEYYNNPESNHKMYV